jgi:very-short-patch-repair endonuclease
MRFIEKGTPKICEECKRDYIPITVHGRPFGEHSKKWIERRFCSKSCSCRFTGRGQKKTLGKHWKMPDGFRMGWKHSFEGRKKISNASKRFWEDPAFRKKVLGRRKMSSLEIKFLDYIKKNNLPYKFVGNGKVWIENCNPDFVNTDGKKIAIEVYCKQHKEKFRDMSIEKWKQTRSSKFEKHGWNIVYFDAVQLNDEKNVIERLGY